VTGDLTARLTDGVDERPTRASAAGAVKCVVWDLDNTLWDGVLLEDAEVRLRPDVVAAVHALDERGILHSVASRNDPELALRKLSELGLAEYFLFPQVGWNPKSRSVATIAEALNIGLDSLAFVDDQPFELAEVSFELPQVRCVPVADVGQMTSLPDYQPRFVTEESRLRREMYRSAMLRDQAEQDFGGDNERFLATLGMVLTIVPAGEDDLQRAEELTIRTNQLNSTGVTYSYADLDRFRTSPDHLLMVAGLTDRFGSYGTIGLALVETGGPVWRLKLLLMSCRVMSRGVGGVLLGHILRLARDQGRVLEADFTETGRNRLMYVTYRFAGFAEVGRSGNTARLRADLGDVAEPPDYLTVRLPGIVAGPGGSDPAVAQR
jgi:FkbH-like protein